ncbi:putative V-type proton ATPase subunit [Halotydeus destructor]|nr:putative V-type proton ATPase subunit [Halotydeus destructor]
MLWRISRGNIFVRHEDIADKLVDPVTGEEMSKVVFVAYFQGVHLRDKVEKVSQGFRATIYSVPDNDKTRKDMLKKVNGQLDDMETVGRETAEMKRKLLVATAKSIHGWQIKIKKMKAVYYTLNMFNLNVAHNMFIGEAWCPLVDLDKAQAALNKATEFSGSSVPSLINKMAAKESPPSFNRTNKFTEGFQLIVNAYGVSNYREVNPAPYTIITFPFLFACMFGDLGHGLLMFLFALVLVLKENSLKSKAATSEMFGMFFGGRYIILLMGVFSMYTGIIYNDTFSKGINIFGSSWRAAHGHGPNSSVQEHHLNLMPGSDYSGTPYPFGIDPVWMIGENKILFLNSYKMKLSVILGVFQMLFGVSLSSINHTFFEKRINLFCEFMPQVIFLLAIFGYMDFMIVYKWFAYSSDNSACAPSVLIMLINMFMMSYPEEPCHLAPMYPGQRVVQTALVIIALVCIPWMLIVKPVLISRQRKADKGFLVQYNASTRRPSRMVNTDTGDEELTSDQVTVDIVAEPRNAANSSEHEKEESMSDVIIHQAIHTIEYCLGSISHTASYLRLWALSLAHAQLSEVLWNMVMRIGLATSGVHGGFVLYAVFALWSTLTVAILLLMEGLSAFLHALRLHWVEFQSKFYTGSGYAFEPFCFKAILAVRPD